MAFSKEEDEACKYFIYNSTKDDKKKVEKAKVGVTCLLGLAYGVGKSIIVEGIFSVQATP